VTHSKVTAVKNINNEKKKHCSHYWCSLISNDARYTREIKSRIVMSKAALKKGISSLQTFEIETEMCYIVSVTFKVLKVRQFEV